MSGLSPEPTGLLGLVQGAWRPAASYLKERQRRKRQIRRLRELIEFSSGLSVDNKIEALRLVLVHPQLRPKLTQAKTKAEIAEALMPIRGFFADPATAAEVDAWVEELGEELLRSTADAPQALVYEQSQQNHKEVLERFESLASSGPEDAGRVVPASKVGGVAGEWNLVEKRRFGQVLLMVPKKPTQTMRQVWSQHVLYNLGPGEAIVTLDHHGRTEDGSTDFKVHRLPERMDLELMDLKTFLRAAGTSREEIMEGHEPATVPLSVRVSTGAETHQAEFVFVAEVNRENGYLWVILRD